MQKQKASSLPAVVPLVPRLPLPQAEGSCVLWLPGYLGLHTSGFVLLFFNNSMET